MTNGDVTDEPIVYGMASLVKPSKCVQIPKFEEVSTPFPTPRELQEVREAIYGNPKAEEPRSPDPPGEEANPTGGIASPLLALIAGLATPLPKPTWRPSFGPNEVPEEEPPREVKAWGY